VANNRIHTTFDLLSANVFNQASLQSIDLPFELVGYSEGTIDSSTGITTSKNKYQNLEAGQRIIIKGFDNTADYKVQTEVTSVVDNQDGTIIFLVLDNFVLELTEIIFYVPNDVKVKHGTIIDGNIQLTTIKDGEDKYPLIFQHEITRETFFNDKRNKLERESEVDLFFLCVADFKEWQIAEHNKFAIKPMRELALKFIEELKTSNGIGEFDTFEILDHVKFGVYTTEKGHTERMFNDNLSGVQLRMTIPFLKTCCCPSEIVNIPTTPCIPRTITRSLKNSLANLVDVELDNPTNTQVLVYVDGAWVNQNQSGGSFDCDDLLGCTVFTDLQTEVSDIAMALGDYLPLAGGTLDNGANPVTIDFLFNPLTTQIINFGDDDVLTIGALTNDNSRAVNLNLSTGGEFDLNTYINDGNLWASQIFSDAGAAITYLQNSLDGVATYMSFGPTTTIVNSDYSGYGGIQYSTDYSANYTNRSLVDKEFVDNTVAPLQQGSISFAIDGNGADIIVGSSALLSSLISNGTITNWYVEGEEASGSIVIDVQRWNGSSYVSIIGVGNKPTITTAKYATAAVASWTSAVLAKGDRIRFVVDSISGFTKANLQVFYTKS